VTASALSLGNAQLVFCGATASLRAGAALAAGAVYVISGGPSRTGDLVLSSAETVITSSEAGNRFGCSTTAGHILSLESAGGSPNLVVGAPGASGNRGAVYLFTGGFPSGGPALTQGDAVYTITGAPGDQLGTSLATGDLDNDGRREIIIGAPGNGRVYIIKRASTLSGTLDLVQRNGCPEPDAHGRTLPSCAIQPR